MAAGSQPGFPPLNQATSLEQLEREGRFPELAVEVSALAQQSEGAERAAWLAKLGEVRLRLDDIGTAVRAFSDSLELEPTQAVARRWLEVLLAEPEHALAAAEALQPAYENEFRSVPHSATMLLAILELRANRSPDHDERIAIWVQLSAMIDHAAAPPDRTREISVRMLARTALEWPGGVGKWIERVVRLSHDPNQLIEALRSALSQPLTDALTISELALAAGHALESSGRAAEARPLYERALAADPSSPEVLGRIDAIAEAAGEAAEPRAGRFRTGIEHAAEPERRAALRVAYGLLQKNVLDDLEAASATLRQAIAEAPALFRGHEALLEIHQALQDDAGVEREYERALSVFDGGERRLTLARLGDFLLQRGRGDEAMARMKPLLDEPELDSGILDFLERLAEEVEDLPAWRRVLERKIERAPEGPARARALETFGEFLRERGEDPRGAAAAWKRAAEILVKAAPQDTVEPERLYERVLELTPDDTEAARRLIELCSLGADWGELPTACRALLDASGDPLAVVEIVLSLEGRATQAGGVDAFATMVDEVASRLPEEREAETRALVTAKARVMASVGRYDEAAKVYEALIETFADEPDVRAYVSLLEMTPDPEWRHGKRAWLFEWRAEHAEDPIAVFTHWATVEEQEFNDIPAAIAVLERAAGLNAARAEVWRELSRLRLETGDPEAGLAALSKLRDVSSGDDARRVELSMAELLVERLGQPQDALPLLESVLAANPTERRSRELMLDLARLLPSAHAAGEALERASAAVDSEDDQRGTLSTLLDATDEASRDGDAGKLRELRRRWYEKLLGLETGEAALKIYERAAAEFPTEDAIWQAVEGGAVRSGNPEGAVRAYEGALARTDDAKLAEALGRRLVAFAEEHVGSPRALAAPLTRLLAVAPGARWAFDRVKLPLTNDQRWDVLFDLYERVIDACAGVDERAALLDEAAVAARDLASDPERAIRYWESYYAIRSTDARVDLALERLYERQQKIEALIQHLTQREAKLAEDEVVRLRERIAGLWLDIKQAKNALTVIESLPKSAALEPNTLALLERVFAQDRADAEAELRKVSRRAARLLKQRYTSLERRRDVADVLVRELSVGAEPKERVKLLGQLAELRRELAEPELEFAALGELMLLEPDQQAHRERLGELSVALANREQLAALLAETAERVLGEPLFPSLLSQAARIRLELAQRDPAIALYGRILDEGPEDEARLAAARELEGLLLEAGRSAERCSVLERIAGLSQAPDEQRKARLEAARVALDELADPGRAAENYRTLLEREPSDITLLDGLLKALRVGERWEEVVDALERRAELESEKGRSRRDLGDAAKIRAERLNHVGGAITAWVAIRERFGRDGESFDHLAALYELSGQFAELAGLLADEAANSPAPAPLYARLAEVHSRHTGDLKAALVASLRAGVLVNAAELYVGNAELVQDDPSLSLELADKLATTGDGPVAERVLRRQIEHYGPRRPKEGARVHLALAALLTKLGQNQASLRELALAADRYPESEIVIAAQGSLAFELGDLERAEQSYRALLLLLGRAATGERVHSRAEVYLSLSQIAGRRGDVQRSEDHVASAFEATLASEEEALSLEGALRRQGRDDLVERAITSRLERAKDPAKIALALRDLVDLRSASGSVEPAVVERALRFAERAVRELESAGGTQTAAWQALLDVFERLGEKERVLSVLEALATRTASAGERTEYDLLIARRLLDLPGRRDAAMSRLWGVVEKDPASAEAYELLSSLVGEDEGLERLLQLLKDQLERAEAASDEAGSQLLGLRLATALEKTGRPREALEAYASLAKVEGSRRAALIKLVELHEQLGSHDRAFGDVLEALLGLESEPERAAELSLKLAELRRAEWDEDGVERALEQGFLRAPGRSEITLPLVKRLLERGAAPRAVDVLERALERAPENVELRLRLAEALGRAKNPERALLALDAALNAGATEGAVRRERAGILESLGRAEEALNELETALHIEGGSSDELVKAIERTNVASVSERWALRAADLSAESGDRVRARALIEPWAERRPDSAQVLTRLGRWATMDRDYAQAIAAYRKLCRVEQGSGRKTAVLSLARVAEMAGKAEDAVVEVEAAIAEGIDSVELRRELGRLYAKTGDKLKQGRMLIEEARAAKAPNQLELLAKGAELLAAEGAMDEALTALDELRKLDPERLDVAILGASVLAASGRASVARERLQELLTGSERKRTKQHAKVFLKLAELALAEDDLAAAYEPLTQAHALDKNDAEIALMLGLLAADLEHQDVAFNSLRAFVSIKEKSTDASSRRQLSRAYTQLGELELGKGQRTVARRMATRAVETDPENKVAQRLMAELGHR